MVHHGRASGPPAVHQERTKKLKIDQEKITIETLYVANWHIYSQRQNTSNGLFGLKYFDFKNSNLKCFWIPVVSVFCERTKGGIVTEDSNDFPFPLTERPVR